ncbi:MAG: hypothetical protein MZV49_17725 [Rhodopseudomonas palustris]|nr:hypothetical protein [Rhodopseudomonas palustris]
MGKVDYLDGQLKALVNFVAVLVKAHPAPDRVRQFFAEANRPSPTPEDLPVSYACLDGYNETNRRLKDLIKNAIEQLPPQADGFALDRVEALRLYCNPRLPELRWRLPWVVGFRAERVARGGHDGVGVSTVQAQDAPPVLVLPPPADPASNPAHFLLFNGIDPWRGAFDLYGGVHWRRAA